MFPDEKEKPAGAEIEQDQQPAFDPASPVETLVDPRNPATPEVRFTFTLKKCRRCE